MTRDCDVQLGAFEEHFQGKNTRNSGAEVIVSVACMIELSFVT